MKKILQYYLFYFGSMKAYSDNPTYTFTAKLFLNSLHMTLLSIE